MVVSRSFMHGAPAFFMKRIFKNLKAFDGKDEGLFEKCLEKYEKQRIICLLHSP